MAKSRRQSKANDPPVDESTFLTLHAIGTGVGESLVLQMPHESKPGMFRWAVIDCCCKSSKPDKNKTLAFLLRNKELGADELEFVCITHPHADHILGMSQILGCSSIRTKRFWRFPSDDQDVLGAFRRMHEDHPGHRDLKQLAAELKRVFEETKTLRNAPDQSKYMRVSGYNSSLFQLTVKRSGLASPIELRIASLAPSGTAQDKYTTALAGCIKPLNSGGWSFAPMEFGAIQNSISVVLLVVFGRTRLILGADAEKSNWEQVLRDGSRKRNGDSLSCDVVKVSHHGSEGAFHPSVWSEHGIDGLPVSLVIPYSPQGLPRSDMVNRLAGVSSELINTNGARKPSAARTRFKSKILARANGPKHAQSPGPRIGSSVQVNHDGQVVAINDLNA